MRESKSISIAMMGLVGGLLSMTPIALAKDRDDTPRGKAAYVTFVPIDFPGAHDTAALDINSAGEIVGRFTEPPGPPGGAVHGLLRNRFGQFTPIDFPTAGPPPEFTVAAGINSRGDIVGQYRLPGQNPNERHGFLRTRDGTFIKIDPPGSLFTNVLGINRGGEIVGRFCTVLPCSPDKRHGFLLRGAALTTIDFPGAAGTNAWGINNRGEIVGGHQDTAGRSHAFQLRESQFETIDFPGAFDTAPDGTKGGINSRGDIVSYYCAFQLCGDSQHGFLLSGGKFTTTMDFPAMITGSLGGHVTDNFGINARGDIVGTYNDANGTAHGFLLKLENREEDEN
jgi:probable HAF family extracellular repeat protein